MKAVIFLLALTAGFAEAKTVEIKMLNSGKEGSMVFEPAFTKVDVGDTLKFTPTDKSHNSTSVYVPKGAKPWVGKPDQAVTVKVTKEGVYIFKCDPHSVMGMVGVVQAGQASNIAEARAEGEKFATTFVMNKDRLKKYLDQAK